MEAVRPLAPAVIVSVIFAALARWVRGVTVGGAIAGAGICCLLYVGAGLGAFLVLLPKARIVTLFPLVVEQLKAQGAQDIVFFGGGTIPQDDAAELKRLGVREVFTPGAPLAEIVDFARRECGKRRELVG